MILFNHGPMNLGTLAGRLGVQRSAAGRMVDRLVAVGLIGPQTNPTRGVNCWPRSPRGA